jgi:translation initiation factor IF-3
MMPGRINGEISAEEVRVIDERGEDLGVFSLADALSLARSRGEDLIEIDAEEEPPLCRVMDYGTYRWQLQQAQKDRAHD